jgi:signal transduction histidine kinase
MIFRLVRKDQNIIWLEQKATSIHDKGNNLIAWEGILRDVTTRINMERLVARAEQMNTVGQLAATVAHEIRNPLTSVRGYLQLMHVKKEYTLSKERCELMLSELDRTNVIISEYLLLAKDKVPKLESCCLNSIINAILPLLQATALASLIEIKVSLEDIPNLYLDENEIRQLLFNLVNNGLEAMSGHGELMIRTFCSEDTVTLAVSDQGTGIPTNIIEKLGTPFLTTKTIGSGLGLPMCYRIAQRHKANIKIETSNQGTTFFVQFILNDIATKK